MNYYIVGKRAAHIDSLIDCLSEKLPNNVTLKHVEPYMLTNERDGKIIYISTPFAFSWDWYISAKIPLEQASSMFCDEIMLFRGFSRYDYRINYTDFDDVVNKVMGFILEDSNENPL